MSYCNESATAFCAYGAICKAAREFDYEYLLCTIDIEAELLMAVGTWNDQEERTKEEVIQMFDLIIERLSNEQ